MKSLPRHKDSSASFGHIRIASFNTGSSFEFVTDSRKGQVIGKIRTLFMKMRKAIEKEEYEDAQKIKDEIRRLSSLL